VYQHRWLTEENDSDEEKQEFKGFPFNMKDLDCQVLSEEKELDEESFVKLKHVNNSNFVPSMHSRYNIEES
jgi:hypothetical protein